MSKHFVRRHLFLALVLAANGVRAEDTVLRDVNGDGTISLLGFGDSITYGVGDGTNPGELVTELNRTDGHQGYLARLSTFLGVPTENEGLPGEFLVDDGERRLPRVLQSSSADIVSIMEGANDAFQTVDSETYGRAIQKMVNVTKALGKTPILLTLPVPCCDHGGLTLFTTEYSKLVREVAVLNDVSYADIDHAWRTSCENKEECELFNLPEGFHPNTKGYDVMAQTVAATTLGIDVFKDGGADDLASAIGVPKEDIVVKPDL